MEVLTFCGGKGIVCSVDEDDGGVETEVLAHVFPEINARPSFACGACRA